MTKHPNHSYPVGRETLLLLAWFSSFDLRALLKQKQKEQSWKPISRLLDEVLRGCIEDALVCLQQDPIYGPVLLRLARHCIANVELQFVTWSIALEELADPSSALFYSDDPYRPAAAQEQSIDAAVNETEVFAQAAREQIPLAGRLRRLSQTWQGDVCRGACELHIFFSWYLQLVQRPLRAPFFLHEILQESLVRINWHVVASQALQVPSPLECRCEMFELEGLQGAHVEFLGELFRLVGDEIVDHSGQLPEPQRTQVLLLMDLCRETTRAMRTLNPPGV